MTKLDITKPEILLLLTEAYEKEKTLRALWVSKHTEKIQLAATLHRKPTNYYLEDVIEHKMIGGMATITRDHEVAGRNRRKVPIRDARSIPGITSLVHENSIINIGLGDGKDDPRLARPDTDLSLDPLMRPIDPKIKRILYKPKPSFGRLKYLAEREKIYPENRYYFPECVSWDHGWRMGDSKMKPGTKHGRCWVLQRTLNNRVGVVKDPEHYKEPMMSTYQKCILL